ncbi:MAG: bifunctional aspartate kinase/homoserine dehydrogenase I [Pyrinomonadaceae bacterium]
MKVLKFGGSSVGSTANIKRVIQIITESSGNNKCVVVLSAMKGTTDALIEIAKTAQAGDQGFEEKISNLKRHYEEVIEELFEANARERLDQFLNEKFTELRLKCEGVFLLRELSPRISDSIVSTGELLSAQIISEKFSSIGVPNVLKDTRELIKTDSNFGFAAVNFDETNKNINKFLKTEAATLYILPGFIASDKDDNTTTLGRGGSDYTAAILAAAADAEVLEIWTDVSGINTADPRLVQNIQHISRITYREAMELSHFGAKVIYPPTILPVMKKGIRILIKNTFEPVHAGTIIEGENTEQKGIIRGITSIANIAILNLEGSGMIGIPGYSKRLFDSLSRSEINVILITQSSSEHSICVAINEEFGAVASDAVNSEFKFEIERGLIDPLRVETGYSILALVGDKMRHHTGVAGRMFATLGANGINITAIAQGSSERNISTIIKTEDVKKAVNTLHEEFFSDGLKQINLFIVGVGTVGSRLLEQIKKQKGYVAEKARMNMRVMGIANSRKQVVSDEELDLSDWKTLLENGNERNELASIIIEKNMRNSIFVDATANAEVVKDYEKLLDRNISIVACNKIAASSEFERYQGLKDLARKRNVNFNFETNVGAGLPIIHTITDLMRSGDRINRIEAVLSGTLNFVFNNYDGSRSFSSVVKQAKDEGYTEPDPRLDLSGSDVARKILILARESGYNLEMNDIEIRAFLPEACLKGNVDDFFVEMEQNESYFLDLLKSAQEKGLTLKYIASFVNGKASVGLEEIGVEHNFANLSGKDNAVLFYTDRYAELPLVVKGAGAGADVTAAGVFADIIRASQR